MGFGPVAPEPDEPVFHADWERRALALTLAIRRDGRTGRSTRAATPARACIRRTTTPRATTRSGSRRWSGCWCATASSPRPSSPRAARSAPGARAEAGAARRRGRRRRIARGAPYDRDPAGRAPAFAAGDAGAHRVMHPPGHTRLPRYARGKARAGRGGAAASTSSPTATRTGAARRRSGSTPWSSTAARALGPRRRPGRHASRSTPGRATLSPPDLPGLPRDAAGAPVFPEPWQARAFALAVHLNARGAFAWPEFAAALGRGARARPGGGLLARPGSRRSRRCSRRAGIAAPEAVARARRRLAARGGGDAARARRSGWRTRPGG